MPTKIILLIIIFFAARLIQSAELPEIRPDHPERYVVVPGDTLWDISARFLVNPWRWNELWQVNPQIANPHLIYPGDVITLQMLQGKISANINRGAAVVKLSPTMRVTQLVDPIPTIPFGAIQSFLIRARITSPEELTQAPYIISQSDQRIIASVGDHIYARGIFSETTNYRIYRAGRPYYRNSTRGGQILLGIEAIPIGAAKLIRSGDPATLLVTQSAHEILTGDRLFTEDEQNSFQQNFLPRAPNFPIDAQIIDVVGGVSRFGRLQIVVLDRGLNDGLDIGHVLTIYQAGKIITDPITKELIKLPQEPAGNLMIFRVFAQLSYALIMEARREMQLFDWARTP